MKTNTYHCQRTYSIAFAKAERFALRNVPWPLANLAARTACSVLVRTALEGSATPYGPYERLFSITADIVATRGLVLAYGDRDTFWGSIPAIDPVETRSLVSLAMFIRYFALHENLFPEEYDALAGAAMAYDPIVERWSGNQDQQAPSPLVAALFDGWNRLVYSTTQPDADMWTSAQTYADGELHRARGWAGRAKASREVVAYGSGEQADDLSAAQQAITDHHGPVSGLVRSAPGQHDEARPTGTTLDLGHHE